MMGASRKHDNKGIYFAHVRDRSLSLPPDRRRVGVSFSCGFFFFVFRSFTGSESFSRTGRRRQPFHRHRRWPGGSNATLRALHLPERRQLDLVRRRRVVEALIAQGYVVGGYCEPRPMVERVERVNGFCDWWTRDNQPRRTGDFCSSVGVMGRDIELP